MTCHETAELLAAYLDDELTKDEADRIEGHLSSCERCALDLARTRRLHALLADPLAAPIGEPSEDRFAALWDRAAAAVPDGRVRAPSAVRGGSRRRSSGGSRTFRWATGIGGGALAAGLALGVWWRIGPTEAPPTKPATLVAARAPARADPERGESAQVAKAQTERTEPAQVAKAQTERTEPTEVASAPAEVDPVAPVGHPRPRAPRDVRRRPDLFLDYSIVRRLDELENFDAVMAKGRGDDRES